MKYWVVIKIFTAYVARFSHENTEKACVKCVCVFTNEKLIWKIIWGWFVAWEMAIHQFNIFNHHADVFIATKMFILSYMEIKTLMLAAVWWQLRLKCNEGTLKWMIGDFKKIYSLIIIKVWHFDKFSLSMWAWHIKFIADIVELIKVSIPLCYTCVLNKQNFTWTQWRDYI